ncbi:MAG: alanine--tRNA ligase [Sedimentisphaeraceae bacterium JB056]
MIIDLNGKGKMLSAKEIRSAFINFFKDKGHTFVPSAPVVPNDDPTLLFTNAGMNQFKDIFLGLKAKSCNSAANSQKCIRVSGKHNDLEEVGVDTYHHTFFEMLGNWSFDDYFKEEAIKWAWELLVDVYKIDAEKLYVTVFAGDVQDGSEYDKEAAEMWPRVTGISPDKVLAFGKKDNFWEMGDTGPCGPCSEIHIDLGPDACDRKGVKGHECGVNGDCGRYIELWNLVFVQYNRTNDGTLVPLSARYIDTGAGLERLTAVLQNKPSNYDTDLFMPIISAISNMAGIEYTRALDGKTDIAMRVIADHIRTLTFAITDGATPGNDGRGYVLRRILRRAARFGRVLDMNEPFMYKLVDVVCDVMGEAFPEVLQRKDFVKTVVESEEKSFGRTLDRGLEIFNAAAEKAENSTISGEAAFQLYDTYGFPLDLTELMARENGLKVDTDGFDKLMEEQRARARAAQKNTGIMSNLNGVDLPATDDDYKYTSTTIETKIVAFVDKDGYKTSGSLSSDAECAVILDKTCFYAESGGQAGDSGVLQANDGSFRVSRTEKLGDCVLHYGVLEQGKLSVDDSVAAAVSAERFASAKNHTATHLLQWALQKVIGEGVAQQGSQVCADYLRFDFTCPKALTNEQIKEVEDLVNAKINAGEPVHCEVMNIEDAKKLGAMALFGEKYGNEVRVVAIGANGTDGVADAFSKEFCGGTHVQRTGMIGGFKIIKEESISAGVRRITALTGSALIDYLRNKSDILDQVAVMLKVAPDQAAERINKLLEDNKALNKQLKDAHKKGGSDIMVAASGLLNDAASKDGVAIVAGIVPDSPVEQLRGAMDMLKKKAQSAVIVLGCKSDDKAMLLAGVTDDVVKKGVKAGDIIKQIAPIVDGRGGGKPQMAQAGGKAPEKLTECIEKAKQIISEML